MLVSLMYVWRWAVRRGKANRVYIIYTVQRIIYTVQCTLYTVYWHLKLSSREFWSLHTAGLKRQFVDTTNGLCTSGQCVTAVVVSVCVCVRIKPRGLVS